MESSPNAAPVDGLTQEEAVLNAVAKRRKARDSLIAFTEYTFDRYKTAFHHRLVAARLEQVLRGDIDRLMLFLRPRHGKSELASRRLPAFALGREPTLQFISASASTPLAADFGRDVRNLVASPEFGAIFPGVSLAEDSQAKDLWRTNAGGVYVAVGTESKIYGRGGDIVLIDDPFGSMGDANRKSERDRIWNWYISTIYNRLQPKGKIIIIGHRLHEDDLQGRLLEQSVSGGDHWSVVQLPAIAYHLQGETGQEPERDNTDIEPAIDRQSVALGAIGQGVQGQEASGHESGQDRHLTEGGGVKPAQSASSPIIARASGQEPVASSPQDAGPSRPQEPGPRDSASVVPALSTPRDSTSFANDINVIASNATRLTVTSHGPDHGERAGTPAGGRRSQGEGTPMTGTPVESRTPPLVIDNAGSHLDKNEIHSHRSGPDQQAKAPQPKVDEQADQGPKLAKTLTLYQPQVESGRFVVADTRPPVAKGDPLGRRLGDAFGLRRSRESDGW
jgi:hypothetical protein